MNVMNRRHILLGGAYSMLFAACSRGATAGKVADSSAQNFASSEWRTITDEEWQSRLSRPAYHVLRKAGTERPWTSPLNDEKRAGIYHCAGCGLELFHSETKYDSGTGWPSFYDVIEANIGTSVDYKIGYPRTEYHCARCLGHQGHVFPDGPQPTGLRYCNNGVALTFKPASV
ncbi:MAG: peptide-methionine (R)-S-oxide reductase MsrB [Pseudomonadota bacterium]